MNKQVTETKYAINTVKAINTALEAVFFMVLRL